MTRILLVHPDHDSGGAEIAGSEHLRGVQPLSGG
jgi:hypothetical protein